jgi:hypothetical protein
VENLPPGSNLGDPASWKKDFVAQVLLGLDAGTVRIVKSTLNQAEASQGEEEDVQEQLHGAYRKRKRVCILPLLTE